MRNYVLASFCVNALVLAINSLALGLSSDPAKIGSRVFIVLIGLFWVGWAALLLWGY